MANQDRIALYASVGPELTQYDVDVEAATLTRRGTVRVPANVQYVWPHASRQFLYVASSDSASGMGAAGASHHVSAFRIDTYTRALTLHGHAIALPTRPIHMATDIPSQHVLVAFNNPSALRVYRINADATLGEEVAQPGSIDAGIFAHQVRATPDNRQVILVTRGHDEAGSKPEEPGALKLFDYRDGVLGKEVSVAPGGGYGFGPRHLDFHPSQPWVYVSLERQNALDLFDLRDGTLSPEPRFRKTTLAAIDPASGEPNPIQHIDTHGIHPRCFHIDPSGRLLVVAHIMGLNVRDGDAVRAVPARLSVFRIGGDGRLAFARAYDVDVGKRSMWWMGII
jgi:6-phosphogluconolactonase (cycloisomerase 2 family)